MSSDRRQNAVTTLRPSTGVKPNRSALHSVCIGTPPGPEINRSVNSFFSDPRSRCTYPFENSGLARARNSLDHFNACNSRAGPRRVHGATTKVGDGQTLPALPVHLEKNRTRVEIHTGVIGNKVPHIVKAVLRRKAIRLVAEMPLARHVSRIAVFLVELGNCRRFLM
jgi:hypothetical protein